MISALITGSRSTEEETGRSVQDGGDPNTLVEDDQEASSEGEEWHVVAELCPVRESANGDGRVFQNLALGTSLRVDEEASMRMPLLHRQETNRGAQRMHMNARGLQWLRLLAPLEGWCLASQCSPGDYASLGSNWRFVVVCSDGAYVREGLELASSHIYTLAKDAVFQVHERRVNEQGLARLRTDDGWISEDLNPLSGQRGPIALLLPISKPLKYRVILTDGAVVRETVELSSAIVHVVPCGDDVIVDEKKFSDHPAQHCVPRLHLLRPFRGWISQRLNREAPDNLPVVELIGLANSQDLPRGIIPPDHDFSEAPHTHRDTSSALTTSRTTTTLRTNSTGTTSAATPSRLSPPLPPNFQSVQNTSTDNFQSDRDINSIEGGSILSVAPNSQNNTFSMTTNDGFGPSIANESLCVVCLSAARNSTFVHGETGHIACCLSCARALAARGDTCPVCRMRIERVIQNFQA